MRTLLQEERIETSRSHINNNGKTSKNGGNLAKASQVARNRTISNQYGRKRHKSTTPHIANSLSTKEIEVQSMDHD